MIIKYPFLPRLNVRFGHDPNFVIREVFSTDNLHSGQIPKFYYEEELNATEKNLASVAQINVYFQGDSQVTYTRSRRITLANQIGAIGKHTGPVTMDDSAQPFLFFSFYLQNGYPLPFIVLEIVTINNFIIINLQKLTSISFYE